VSRTFEGRDRFAPAAGWLAKGINITWLGKSINDFATIVMPKPTVAGDEIQGEVVRIDRFGNLITNIDRKTFERFSGGGTITVHTGNQDVGRVVATYAEAPIGELCALFGSTDHLEVAINAGDAASRLGLARRAPVIVRR
jgi:S-adenosylmethionine hydrolase